MSGAVTAAPIVSLFQEMLDARVDGGSRRCLSGELAEAFSGAARRAGKRPLGLTAPERARLAREGVDWPVLHWALDDLARVTLLLIASATPPAAGTLSDLVETCYRQGDNRERQAVLYALPLLPAPEQFLDLAVEACRSHVQPVFDAIACENPYPLRHFPELSWNQMVLKAVFTGVALERIVGLPARVTAELQRMAGDYASERRAAGRPVPADLERLMALGGSER